MSDHECPLCGCIPIEEAIPAVLASIREEGRLVPPRLSALLGSLDTEQKATIVAWLTGTLERPPLDTGAPAWRPIVDALAALLFDISDTTLEYVEAAGWAIPLPHRRVVAAMRGERSLSHGDGSSTTVVTDADGFLR